MSKKKSPTPQHAAPSELSGIYLGGDGSIEVKCRNVQEAERIALRLHKRQSRRLFLDHQYR